MIIITGGLGFIGTHLADAYLAAGADVLLIDSMVASVTEGTEYEAHPGAKVVRLPVERWLAEDGSFDGATQVVHAASHVGPARILSAGGHLGPDVVGVTHAVVQACIAADVPLTVFSSAEVYGRSGLLGEDDPLVVPMPLNARLEYALGKATTEAMIVNAANTQGLVAYAVRPFNVVGARQSRAGGFVMPTFVQQALAGVPLTVFAGGRQRRAFTAVHDVADFVVQRSVAAFASGHHVFNLGNPDNTASVLELADAVRWELGSDVPIEHTDGKLVHGPLYEEAASVDKLPRIARARSLGWEPHVGLAESIALTASHYTTHAVARGALAPL